MTKTFNTTDICKTDHSMFGGIIYQSDFNTDYRKKDTPHGSAIASRIAQDYRFDQQCQKNIEFRNMYQLHITV